MGAPSLSQVSVAAVACRINWTIGFSVENCKPPRDIEGANHGLAPTWIVI